VDPENFSSDSKTVKMEEKRGHVRGVVQYVDLQTFPILLRVPDLTSWQTRKDWYKEVYSIEERVDEDENLSQPVVVISFDGAEDAQDE